MYRAERAVKLSRQLAGSDAGCHFMSGPGRRTLKMQINHVVKLVNLFVCFWLCVCLCVWRTLALICCCCMCESTALLISLQTRIDSVALQALQAPRAARADSLLLYRFYFGCFAKESCRLKCGQNKLQLIVVFIIDL